MQTTLLKYILTEKHGYRVAVILNEYADEQGIESAFLQDAQVRPAGVGLRIRRGL
jgi:G3E family GTPase